MLKSALQKQYPQVSKKIWLQLYLFSVIVSFKAKSFFFAIYINMCPKLLENTVICEIKNLEISKITIK